MAGLKQHFPEFTYAGGQVSQNDIDQYQVLNIANPVASFNWFGTAKGTGVAATVAIGQINQLTDWPRNQCFSITGIAAGVGGSLTANIIDQFGSAVTETIGFATANAGGTVYGTAIVQKWLSGTVTTATNNSTTVATVAVGLGTAPGASGNWFGLMTKIAGTNDIKNIVWDNNGTVTTLNGGTAIGTLIQITPPAFQGTSGVAITDSYRVTLKPSFDNSAYGTMSNL